MSTKNNPDTGDPALVCNGGREERKVFCNCCDTIRLVGVIMHLLHFCRVHLCFPDNPVCQEHKILKGLNRDFYATGKNLDLMQ